MSNPRRASIDVSRGEGGSFGYSMRSPRSLFFAHCRHQSTKTNSLAISIAWANDCQRLGIGRSIRRGYSRIVVNSSLVRRSAVDQPEQPRDFVLACHRSAMTSGRARIERADLDHERMVHQEKSLGCNGRLIAAGAGRRRVGKIKRAIEPGEIEAIHEAVDRPPGLSRRSSSASAARRCDHSGDQKPPAVRHGSPRNRAGGDSPASTVHFQDQSRGPRNDRHFAVDKYLKA